MSGLNGENWSALRRLWFLLALSALIKRAGLSFAQNVESLRRASPRDHSKNDRPGYSEPCLVLVLLLSSGGHARARVQAHAAADLLRAHTPTVAFDSMDEIAALLTAEPVG